MKYKAQVNKHFQFDLNDQDIQGLDLVVNDDMQTGDYDIHWLEKYLEQKSA